MSTTLATAATLVVSIVTSILAEFVPGWSKFTQKKLTMALVNLAVPILVWVAICPIQLPVPVTVDCADTGLLGAIGLGIMGALANKGVYENFVRPLSKPHATSARA
jgi:uncharacterized membrane protein